MTNTAATMTPRERLFAFLRGEPTDRVPMWLLFPFAPTSYYVNVREHPDYRKVYEASRDRVVMLNRRNLDVPLFTPEVRHQSETVNEDGHQVHRQRWRYRGLELTDEHRHTGATVIRKPMLSTDQDLEALAEFPIETDARRITAHLDEHLPKYTAEREAFPERYGSMMLDLGEPIGVLYRHADLEEYAIWSMTHSDLVTSVLDRLMQRYRLIYGYTLSRALAEVYFLVGSELASPPLTRQRYELSEPGWPRRLA